MTRRQTRSLWRCRAASSGVLTFSCGAWANPGPVFVCPNASERINHPAIEAWRDSVKTIYCVRSKALEVRECESGSN